MSRKAKGLRIAKNIVLALAILDGLRLFLPIGLLSYLRVFGGFSWNAGEAGAIGIIGGADGPTAIFTTTKMAVIPTVVEAIVFVGLIVAWLVLRHKYKAARTDGQP